MILRLAGKTCEPQSNLTPHTRREVRACAVPVAAGPGCDLPTPARAVQARARTRSTRRAGPRREASPRRHTRTSPPRSAPTVIRAAGPVPRALPGELAEAGDVEALLGVEHVVEARDGRRVVLEHRLVGLRVDGHRINRRALLSGAALALARLALRDGRHGAPSNHGVHWRHRDATGTRESMVRAAARRDTSRGDPAVGGARNASPGTSARAGARPARLPRRRPPRPTARARGRREPSASPPGSGRETRR